MQSNHWYYFKIKQGFCLRYPVVAARFGGISFSNRFIRFVLMEGFERGLGSLLPALLRWRLIKGIEAQPYFRNIGAD